MESDWEFLRSLEFMIFGDHWITPEKYEKLTRTDSILLVAVHGDKPVGFKLGYQKGEDTFHSWLGGVHQDYRRQGIAQTLMDEQESHVRGIGLKRITFNTYDKFSGMIKLGQKNGYELIRTEQIAGEHKYFYEKLLADSSTSSGE